MKINVEKREIVGVVKTDWQKYNLLDLNTRDQHIGNFVGSTRFHVVDEEGFDTYVFIRGYYTVIVNPLYVLMDVKVVLSDEEAQDLDKTELFADEIQPKPN